MNNWIICPVRNNLALTQRALPTFRAQDIGNVCVFILNNGSTDGTGEWLRTQRDIGVTHRSGYGESVAASWNRALKFVFGAMQEDYALVVNNDVELRPDTYRYLAADGGGFVTAVGTRDPGKIQPAAEDWYAPPDPGKKRPHPDFSCFLIRREVYETVGPFDENFKVAYCEDSDYHVRMYRAGIRAIALELPFLHHGAQTIRNAEPSDLARIAAQAQINREYFQSKYGFGPGTPEYYAAFGHEPPPEEPPAEKEFV